MELSEHLKKQNVPAKLARLIQLFAREGLAVRQAFLQVEGLSDTRNVYGEQQMELDKWADAHFIAALKESRLTREIASEEQAEVVEGGGGPFAVCMDPLDGSSCIETNLAVGTIFGVHKDSVRKPGRDLLAAGYILYGPLTTFVYCVAGAGGVHEFVADPKGKFRLREENLRLGSKKIFGPGGAKSEYLPAHARFIEGLEAQGYKIRFSGSFVADFNQILHYGGLFTYPATREAPQGKLRLLFECAPLAFLCLAAGGDASTGMQKVLEVLPTQLSQRVPLYVGGKKEIALVERCFKE
ncbi:MAG TPA: fructose-1,6-bisphosphatase [Candidatus Diapherotrites archaeon]|uniref:fructose-bisphosphatase n=1 Tax=Candidatus Iainarchaeum sp. TaxID=3101447 RepID=A0A7J4JLL2_9ARCH|nr:fructose-1,6-bisphosphatase [Candidatus Diapherotrites archaeon]HIH17195.1 fructose-1,6-bisphosphatase [Candidatus Diapherotrites archaeon]